MQKYFTLFCLFVFFILVSGCKKYVSLDISNKTEVTVTDVLITYTGGCLNLASLPPSSTTCSTIRSSGGSSVYITFCLSDEIITVDLDTYIEPGYTGNMQVYIEVGGNVTSKQDIKPNTK